MIYSKAGFSSYPQLPVLVLGQSINRVVGQALLLPECGESARVEAYQSTATGSDPESAGPVCQQTPYGSAVQFCIPKLYKSYPIKTSQAIIATEPKIAVARLGQSVN